MILWVLIGIIIIIILIMMSKKITIDIRSFFSKTIPLDRGKFGVYCFTGKQGSGKTYSLVKYIKKHKKDADTIYSNVTIEGLDYVKLESVEHLLWLRIRRIVSSFMMRYLHS